MEDISTKSKTEQVAQRLLDRIIVAGLSPGSNFGTEASLLEQFDVSRPTLRESLRILEAQGVLELRPGPGGGIMVRKPSTDILAHGLSVFLRLNDVPFLDILQAREVIEPALAFEAAINGTAEQFAELEESIDRMQTITDQEVFVEENRVFHEVIARASGNKVLETFWSTISILAGGTHHGVRLTSANQQHVIKAHQGILKACRQGDGKSAAAKMKEHVTELENLVRKHYAKIPAHPTRIVARSGRL